MINDYNFCLHAISKQGTFMLSLFFGVYVGKVVCERFSEGRMSKLYPYLIQCDFKILVWSSAVVHAN